MSNLVFSASPVTVYFSSNTKNNSHTTIEVTVSNPKGGTNVDLKSIVLNLPCGDSATDLLPKGQFANISPSMKEAGSPWNPSLGAVTGEIDILPKSGTEVKMAPDTSVTIILEGITLTSVQGTAVVEGVYKTTTSSGFSTPQKMNVEKKESASAILDFTSTPASIAPGNSATLSWKTALIDYVKINPGDGKQLNANGSLNVKPNGTTIYTLWAYGKNVLLSKQWVVVVDRPQILTFGPLDGISNVDYGSKATLKWTCNDDTKSVSMNPPPSKLIKPDDSLEVGPLVRNMSFELIAFGDTRSNYVTQSTPITINPPQVLKFDTNPASSGSPIVVDANSVVELVWETKSTWMVSMAPSPNPPITGGDVNGSTKFKINGDMTITLTAHGTDGRQISKSLEFKVKPKS